MWRRSLLAVVLALCGCAGISFQPTYAESSWSRLRAARWDGPACGHVLYSMQEVGERYNSMEAREDPTPEAQILLAVCTRRTKTGTYGHKIDQWPRVKEIDPTKAYLAQDDARLDVLSAAVTVAHVANALNRERRDIDKQDVALALFWRRVVDETALEKALARVAIPPEAKAAFVTQYRMAPVALSPLLNEDERQLLVELPVQIFRARQEQFRSFAKLYARHESMRGEIEAARAGRGDRDAIVVQLEALRSDYMDACAKAECRHTPLWANVTRDLAQLHALRNDALASRAEALMIHSEYYAGLAQAVWLAQRDEYKRLKELWEKYERAKRSGYDETAARQLAAGAPREELGYGLLIEPSTSLPDYSAPLGDDAYRIRQDSGEVSDVQGDVVKFRGGWPSEVRLPAREARLLKAGDQVKFVSDGKKGRVLTARRRDRVVMIRGDRVP